MAQVLNKRSDQVSSSGVPVVPSSSQLSYGELAINYADNAETLFIKNSDNEIVSFSNDNALLNYIDNKSTARIYYGTCSTTANTYAKSATVETFPLDSNNKPLVGTVVGIKFTVTNTYKTSGHTYTLNVNNTGAYPMYYNNAALATSTSANTLVAGYANRHVFYMFNGSQWVFLSASYDSNSTYSGMTQAEITAGTGTTARLITPKMLRDNFYTEDEVDGLLADKADTADLADVATSGSYNDLTDTPTIPTVPTNVSAFTNDSGYLTSHQSLSGYATELWVGQQGYLTSHQDISGKANKNEMSVSTSNDQTTITLKSGTSATVINAHQDISGKANSADLATVATSGNYNDLSNKPSIPSIAIEQSVTPGNTTITVGGVSKVIVQDSMPTGSSQAYIAPSWGALNSLTSGKANASEMSVSTSGDQTIITLKNGTSATVINSHQSLASKQDVIDSTHKLSADLIDNGTTNKVYTATEQSKLSGIESGAQVNVIETIKINNSTIIGYQKERRLSLETEIFVPEYVNSGESTAYTKLSMKTKQSSNNTRHDITSILASDTSDLNENWAMLGDTAIPTVGLVKSKIDTKATSATTLSGYGITDAKIENGVITLGSNTITPLTSHQDISGKVNSSDLATVATTGSYTDLIDAPQYVLCTLTQYNAMQSHDSDTYYLILAESTI